MLSNTLTFCFRSLQSFYSFALVPVGHLSMPGPVNITYNDIVGDNDKNKTTLLHWNPGREEFTLRSVLSLIIKKGYGCK
jgi:hypothetical protein